VRLGGSPGYKKVDVLKMTMASLGVSCYPAVPILGGNRVCKYLSLFGQGLLLSPNMVSSLLCMRRSFLSVGTV